MGNQEHKLRFHETERIILFLSSAAIRVERVNGSVEIGVVGVIARVAVTERGSDEEGNGGGEGDA